MIIGYAFQVITGYYCADDIALDSKT